VKTRYPEDEGVSDPLQTRAFHELAMAYRHSTLRSTGAAEWEEMQAFLRQHMAPRERQPAQLHVLKTGNLQDIPGTLRNLADQIEQDEFGTVEALAWTLDTEGGYALGMIGGGHPSEAHLLFSVAASAMVEAVLQGKERL